MADEQKTTKVYGLTSDNAVLLLEAAENLGLDASTVRTSSEGYFTVPQEVADKAGLAPAEEKSTSTKRRTARSTSGKDED